MAVGLSEDTCNFCTMLRTPPAHLLVSRLRYGTVFIYQEQFFRGHTLLVYNEDFTDIGQLNAESALGFYKEALITAKAVQDAFAPDKLNFAMLGNVEPHLHWHIIPRYASDPLFGGPPWPHDTKYLDKDDYRDLSLRLRAELKKYTGGYIR